MEDIKISENRKENWKTCEEQDVLARKVSRSFGLSFYLQEMQLQKHKLAINTWTRSNCWVSTRHISGDSFIVFYKVWHNCTYGSTVVYS